MSKLPKKNKKYYWFKLKDDFFTDPKIKKLRRIAGGDTYTVILLKTMLLTLKTDGILVYEGIEKTLAEELALKLDEDDNNVLATLSFMQQMKLLEEVDINTYDIPQVRILTGSESASTSRVRKHREKQKTLHCNSRVTERNKNVTTEIENKREEIEKEPLSLSLSLKNKEDFHNFRKKIKSLYLGQPLVKGAPPFLSNTIIELSSVGYLHNTVSNKYLNNEDAFSVWKYIFLNQDKIIPLAKEEK